MHDTTNTTTYSSNTSAICESKNVTEYLGTEDETIQVEIEEGCFLTLPQGKFTYTRSTDTGNCTIHIDVIKGKIMASKCKHLLYQTHRQIEKWICRNNVFLISPTFYTKNVKLLNSEWIIKGIKIIGI